MCVKVTKVGQVHPKLLLAYIAAIYAYQAVKDDPKNPPQTMQFNLAACVNITIYCYNVRTTNVIQQVTVCARNVHQELWHKHEDEYATVLLRYRWCADRVHPTRRRYVLTAHWCPSRGVCKPPASPTTFCSLPDQVSDCSVVKNNGGIKPALSRKLFPPHMGLNLSISGVDRIWCGGGTNRSR